jgi:alpha-tubulin suppressor-like RCC1 family protein
MISSQNLINKICSAISCGNLTTIQCCQTTGSLELLCQPVFSVENIATLPDPNIYNGRMVYVTNENKYYYAVLGIWDDDFSSVPRAFSSHMLAWGNGANGRLGDNTTVNKSSPVSVVGGFTDWCQVSAGDYHSLGTRQNSTAWAWGCNGQGRLGDNTVVSTSSPVQVLGDFTDWCQVSAGCVHSLGVTQGGIAYAWGSNLQGRLGDNTTVSKSSPVSVVGGFTDWCQLSAGGCHSLGTRQNGTAWAWGNNFAGRLGDNTGYNRLSPVSVVAGFTDWCQVSAGKDHSLGTRQNGTAWAWGYNTLGRLGDNTIVIRSSPVSVVGDFTDWCQLSAGSDHSLGVRQSGTAWAWGAGSVGRLGDNTTINKSSPVQIVGGFTDWCQLSAGGYHSLGTRQNGTAWAWGAGSVGRLGDNTAINKSSPVQIVGGFTDWCQVSAGCNHSLAIRQCSLGL